METKAIIVDPQTDKIQSPFMNTEEAIEQVAETKWDKIEGMLELPS
jgi:hypothetical protein